MTFDPLTPLPYLTAAWPGIGGQIKQTAEDFEVEEIPAYQPSGQGDFLYLWIEKRGIGAEYFVRQLAQRLGIRPGDIGTAGMKDRHAVTRQMVSVPANVESYLSAVEGDGIRLLSAGRHGNKLRPGHLRGNRFRIVVRGANPHAMEVVAPIVEKIKREGMPNFYGAQRMGREGETALLGLALLHGEKRRVNPFLRRLALSAAQSVLFNHCLARRMADGFYRQIIAGDVMAKWPFGGMFVAQDLAAEQARFDSREIVHAGPMFGRKTFKAAELAAAREFSLLQEAGLSQQSFQGFGKLLQGTRRHNLIYIDDLEVQTLDGAIVLAFTLPAGSYATILLREVMKASASDRADEGNDSPDDAFRS